MVEGRDQPHAALCRACHPIRSDRETPRYACNLSGVTGVKILHLIQRYPPAVGGSETWCREVSRYLCAIGDEVKVLTLDILEEEEYWKDPDRDRWRVQLGRVDWDDGVLVRRYRRSLPIHLLHHLVFRLILDTLLRIYFYGPHSIEMYGRLFAEAKAADVVHLHTMPHPTNLTRMHHGLACKK